jgi:aminoglycoside phosphotransferase (APT) family kinase protein
MRWLWAHDAGVPQPLGWIAELSMLTYVPVSGRLLGDTIFDERAATDMEWTAEWLAALHASPLPLDRSFDVTNELKNLREWSSVVGARHPDQAHAAERISAQLAQLPTKLGGAPSRPIHKDFHLQHVFVADRARVIDLDEVRLGDPTFDVAHFCAYLRLLGLRAPDRAACIDRRRDEFLAAYRRRSECDLNGRFDAFYAYTCLKIAKQLCTLRGLEPRPRAEEEHRQTAAILHEGLAALGSA